MTDSCRLRIERTLMRTTPAMRPAAALMALAISSASMIGFAGTAHAAPRASTETAQSADPVGVTITWDLHSSFGVGYENVLPGQDPPFDPADVIVSPSDAEGGVRYVATNEDGTVDLGLQPLVDGRSVAPTWELPGGPVVDDARSATWYWLTAEFVPDEPSEHQGAVVNRDLGWVQLTDPGELPS